MPRPRKWFPTDKTCPACDTVWRATSTYQILIQKFCSRACRTKVHGNGRAPVKKTKRNCLNCDVEMEVLPCHLKTKRFCSHSCSSKYRNQGANNPAWKGGIAHGGRYWKRQAKKSDDYICQFPECGYRSRKNHAHHKIPRAAGGEDTLENLITLCGKHHREMERQLLARLIERVPDVVQEVASQLYSW